MEKNESAVCDTRAARTVTPSRSYRTFQPALLLHEETLVRWWKGCRTFDGWMAVSHKCAGASAACSDYRNGTVAATDFATAGALAVWRALDAPVTPSPATVSRGGGVEPFDDPPGDLFAQEGAA